jgi:hypothetical protein
MRSFAGSKARRSRLRNHPKRAEGPWASWRLLGAPGSAVVRCCWQENGAPERFWKRRQFGSSVRRASRTLDALLTRLPRCAAQRTEETNRTGSRLTSPSELRRASLAAAGIRHTGAAGVVCAVSSVGCHSRAGIPRRVALTPTKTSESDGRFPPKAAVEAAARNKGPSSRRRPSTGSTRRRTPRRYQR